jgi:glucose/arabinose dehydrogenase
MPFDPAVDAGVNDAGQVDCGTMTRITKGIQAHSAPLGFIFLQGTNVASQYQQGALIALHGSWDRSTPTGYKLIWVPWAGANPTTGVTPTDFVAGWNASGVWGRPVGVAVDPSGAVYITDDASGTVYKLTGH